MANPVISDLHISAALTNLSVGWAQSSTGFVFDKVFATVPVQKQSDKYFVYDRQDFLRSDAGPRAPGTPAPESGWRLSDDNYFCDRKALRHTISDPERANADPAINLDQDTVEWLTQDLMIAQEVDWVTVYMSTGVWTGASSTGDMTGQAAPASTATNFLQWNDPASVPIEDVAGEQDAVAQRTGKRATDLILGEQVYTALKNHPDILDRIKFTGSTPAVATPEILAKLFDVRQVHVMQAVRDSAVEGGTASFAYIGGKNALLVYAEKAPSLRRASGGYRFVWTGMGQPAQGARIKRYRWEENEGDIIEAEVWYDEKVVSALLGAYFKSAVA